MNNNGMEEYEDQEIDIHSVGDIIALRMAVRQFARQVGLDITSQSSISLATSHLAYKLGMDTHQDGHISVLSRHEGYRVGVQLLLTMKMAPNQAFSENTFHDIRGLIDELDIDISPNRQITVRIVKWTHSWQVAF